LLPFGLPFGLRTSPGCGGGIRFCSFGIFVQLFSN